MKNPLLPCAVFIALLSVLFLMISCPQAAVRNPYEDLEAGTFWAQNLATNKYYTVDSVLLAEGGKCVVWAERSAGVSVAAGVEVAREYDEKIYPVIVETFGSDKIMEDSDVDGDGKLTLLLLDIKDGFNGTGAYTAGYFFSNDLLLSSSNDHSNERDMLYVDTYPSSLGSKDSYATIAHELQHFINFSMRSSNGYRSMDIWIDEGLSAAAEYVYLGQHNKERITQFAYSETIQQGNNFFVWGERPAYILDEYSTVYLFFQWLRIQSGGLEIFRRIIASEQSDYRAVTEAISGTFAAELGSTSWETILRSWLAANYINSPEGLYGYHDEISELQVWALGGRTQQLWPGEGVYSLAGDSPGALPGSGGPNIRYAGLRKAADSPSEPLVSLDALYPNGRLLTFNSNERKNDSDERGRLTGGGEEAIPQPPPSTGTGRSAGPAGDSWVIDARDILGRPDDGDG
ncbi:MAG: hypothetical protein LBG14_02285 [Treponema sp.]|jgi:hypothetical protein|nr:hypothetical protein [Treponema sp.]